MSKEHARDTILDSIADGVFTVDKDWRITSFNRAAQEITGVPHDEAIGKSCCDVFRASICEEQCALKETLRTARPLINKAIYILDSKGQQIPISISTAILRDGWRGPRLGVGQIVVPFGSSCKTA